MKKRELLPPKDIHKNFTTYNYLANKALQVLFFTFVKYFTLDGTNKDIQFFCFSFFLKQLFI